MRSLAGYLLGGLVIAACSSTVPVTMNPGAAAEREPAEQAFGPDYPAQPASGRRTRIDSAELSADQKTLTIQFVGGKPYLASDACSEDYEPWVAPHGDELDVVVVNVERADQVRLGPNMGCTMEGYGITYHLKLAAPFTGTTANDLASGGMLYVRTPPGALVATTLPPGWSFQLGVEQGAGPPAIWVEVYSAGPVGDQPAEGPGRLVLYQAFGIYGEWSDTRASKSEARGGHTVGVTLNGAPATVWFDEASGELLLAWSQNGLSLGLIGNAADMTAEDLATYAEGVAPSGS